ncbi:unnamed protein product [Mesocestoides corti]|uniref:Uncharacterized protein n=1 Tax=Mesocestoides corti TaxID=53468 RepID=A0A0R3URB7_MESCO|nr:unnamed protein product [Mesocestoides corti]
MGIRVYERSSLAVSSFRQRADKVCFTVKRRSRLGGNKTKLIDPVMRLELEEAEVCHIKEVISRLNIDLDSRDTPVVMTHEAKAAADTALQQLTDNLATLGARLQFDVSGACLLTPEATSLAESVASIPKEREQKVQLAWDCISKMSAEMAAINDIERLEKRVQTTTRARANSAALIRCSGSSTRC